MGKKNLLVMAASIFLATANAPTATAQEAGELKSPRHLFSRLPE